MEFDGEELNEKLVQTPIVNAQLMPVPSSFNDINEGVEFRDHYGWMWYERTVTVPKSLLSQRLVLRLDAVTHQGKVYINGKFVTQHRGGFTPFEAEINEFIIEGKNRITVAVCNIIDESTLPVGGVYVGQRKDGSTFKIVNPNMDFFNYAGINRSVRIYTTPKNYISDVTIKTDIANSDATVRYDIETNGNEHCTVTIYDEEGVQVAEGSGQSGTLMIKDAKLWQPLNAYLYSMVIKYGDDEYTEQFGIRTVEVKDGQFLINGKPFYFKGFGKHEDNHISGRGLNIPAYVKDINLMKWIGANSMRTAHYPYSEEFLRLCDREGIVVIDECAAVGLHFNLSDSFGIWRPGVNTWQHIKTHNDHQNAIRELIRRDKNHPCVVMWSISNEAAETTEGAYEYFKPMFDLARKLDNTRPLTNVSLAGSVSSNNLVAPLVDVVCLNRYYGWYTQQGDLITAQIELEKEIDGWVEKYPEKPIIFAEYGADSINGIHDTTPVMFTEEFQRDFIAAYSESFDKYKNIVGEHVWNFADFYAVQGIKRVQGNRKGVFTRERKPKIAAHWLKSRWENIPDFEYKK